MDRRAVLSLGALGRKRGPSIRGLPPAGAEGWLPIEGLMQLKYFLITGKVPHVHAAGFFLFTSFLVISFVFRKAFCALDVSGGYRLGICVEVGPLNLW